MTTNKFQQSVSVFITTAANIEAGKTSDVSDGVILKLEDYNGHDEFLLDAVKQVKEKTGETSPELVFEEYFVAYWVDDLIKKDSVSPKLWDMMCHDSDTLDVLWSYGVCFDVEEEESVDEQIAVAQQAFIGHFDSALELVENWLERTETSVEVIDIIRPNLDITAVADEVVKDLRFVNGYYFQS